MGTLISLLIIAFILWFMYEAIVNGGSSFHCTGKVSARVRRKWKCCSCKRIITAGEIAYHSGADRRELGRVYMCSSCKNKSYGSNNEKF